MKVHTLNLASPFLLGYLGAFYSEVKTIAKKSTTVERTTHFYIIQELAKHGTLAELLALSDIESDCPEPKLTLSLHDKLEICLQIAKALQFLHSSKLKTFHRDVKADNVLVAGIS